MVKTNFGKKKNGIRILSWILAVIVFITSIPGQAFVAKAEMISDWKEVEHDFSSIWSGVFGKDRFLVLEGDGTVWCSKDGSEWEDVGEITNGGSLKYCGEYFFVYGAAGYFLRSVDGCEWQKIDIGDKKINCITYAEGKYYALTGEVRMECEYFMGAWGESLMCSEDGFHWEVLNENVPSTQYVGITYGNGMLVGLSRYCDKAVVIMDLEGNILSDFEVDYGEQFDDGCKIDFINGVFVLNRAGGIYISEDAREWHLLKKGSASDAEVLGDDYYKLNRDGSLLHFPNVSMGNKACNEIPADSGMTIYSIFGGKGLLFGVGYNKLWVRSYRYEAVSDNSVSDNTVSGNEAIKEDKLTGDMIIDGDYHIMAKKLDLNGHTLTVKGTLTCADAQIKTSGGHLCVQENVTIEDKTQIEGVVNIEGNLQTNGGYLSFSHAQVNVGGDVEVTNTAYNYGLCMTNEDDVLYVAGDFGYHAPYEMGKTKGKIVVSGDIDITGNFTQGENQIFCLNGSRKQSVRVTETAEFGFVQAQNTSEEGIFINRILNAKEFESNGSKFNYGEGNEEGVLGYKLTENKVIDGDLYLMDGVLDLNGFTLHVKGNLIQASGMLFVNGGSLIVESDYRLQYRTGNEEYTYDSGKGVLRMTNSNDIVQVKGDFYVQSNVSMEGYLSDGTLILEGDFTQTGENIFIATENHKVIFEQKSNGGETTHKVSLDDGNRFHIMQLEQAKKYEFEKDIQGIADETVYGDSVVIPEAPALAVEEVSSKTVTLQWTPCDGENITYQVYRKRQYNEDEYVRIADGLTENIFHDQDTQNWRCYYKVVAVNGMNLKSEYSQIQSAECNYLYFYNIKPVAKSSVGGESTEFQIRFEGYSGTDNTVTVSYLTEDGETYEKISEYVITKEEFEDYFGNRITMEIPWDTFQADQDLTLKFEIFDRDGVVSTRTYQYTLDITPPEVPTNLEVRESHGDAYLTWTKSSSEDCSKYEVYRKEQDGLYELIGTSSGAYYKDQTTEPEIEYTYYIVAVDEVENKSQKTDEVSIRLEPDTTVPQVQINAPDEGTSWNATQQIYVSATDNRKLSNTKVYLMQESGEKILLTEKSTNSYSDYINFAWNTSEYIDGVYLISVVAEDKEGNVSEEVSVACCVDNTPPEKVEGVECIATDTSIRVSWDIEEEVEAYIVEWYAVGDEDSKNTYYFYDTCSYTIQYLKPETEYIVNVYAEDKLHNRNEAVSTKIVTLKDTESPVIKTVSPESAYSINRWTQTLYLYAYAEDNVALSDAIFSYSIDGENFQEISTDTGDGYKTQYYNTNLNVEEFTEGCVTIMVEVSDIYGNTASEKKEYIIDRIPPEAPKNFVAESPEHAISLSWETDDTDIQYYYLYRSNKNTGLENESFRLTENSFIDSEVTLGEVYQYTIYAVDKSGNYGITTDPIMIMSGPEPDTTPPESVTDLYCTNQSGSSITLMWSEAKDNMAVDHYNVYRDEVLIAEVKDNSYIDRDESLVKDEVYRYHVTAEDAEGNEAELSNEAEGKLIFPQLYSMYPVDKAEFGGEKITLEIYFLDGENEAAKYMNLSYYDPDAMERIYLIQGERVDLNHTRRYVDVAWNLTNLCSGSYTVLCELYDEDGNKDTMERMYVLDRTAPYAPQSIRCEEENGVVKVAWSASDSEDCAGYYVLRRKDSEEEYKIIDIVYPSEELIYTDTFANGGETYYYAVQAYDNYSQLSEYSKEIRVAVSADEEAPTVQTFTPDNSKVNGILSLKVTATDNRKLSNAKFYLVKEEKEELLDTVSFSGDTATTRWNTKTQEDGMYIIKAVVEDEAGNKSEPLGRVYNVDNTGVSAVEITEYIAYDSEIILIWESPEESDCTGFYVQQLIDGSYVNCGSKVTTLNKTVEGLDADTEYSFRIVAVDDVGNLSQNPKAITIRTKPDTTAPVISQIGIFGEAATDSIHLLCKASDNCGIDYVKYSYKTSENDLYQEIIKLPYYGVKETNADYSWDVSDCKEGTVTVKYEVVDLCGNTNVNSITRGYRIDRTPPMAVQNVILKNTKGCVSLAWDSPESDALTYEIYRKEEGGEYVCIGKDFYVTRFTDTSVTCDESYIYKVRAVDEAGNIGEFSEEITATVGEDTENPHVYAIRAKNGDTEEVGCNPEMVLYATDNSAIAHITLSYGKSGENDRIEEQEFDITGKNVSLEFVWKTEGMEDGEYEFTAMAEDKAGNVSQAYVASFVLDNHAPEAPVIETQGDYNSVNVSVMSSTDTYSIKLYRREKGESEFKEIEKFTSPDFVDAGLEIKKEYEYQAVAYDKAGNMSVSDIVSEMTTGVDVTPPTCLVGDYMSGRVEREVRFDALLCEDNAGIVSYAWDFGDGTFSKRAVAMHTYKEPGDYAYSLTVTDAVGNTSTKNGVITVKEQGMVVPIKIVDALGKPVQGASVVVDSDDAYTFTTDSEGYVYAVATDTELDLHVYKDGCGMTEQKITVSEDGKTDPVVYESATKVSGNLTYHEMTYEEMVEAGIDMLSEENRSAVEFNLKLTFSKSEIPVTITNVLVKKKNGSYVFGGGGSNSSTLSGSVKNKDGSVTDYNIQAVETPQGPVLACTTQTETVSCLNNMYCMELTIINDSEKEISNAGATLRFDEGVKLAKTLNPQSSTIDMGTISAGSNATASWIVCAEKSGTYNVYADFTCGNVTENSKPTQVFHKLCTFECNGLSGLHLIIRPEKDAYIGENYYIQYELRNESDHDMYAVQTTFGKYQSETAKFITIMKENGETVEKIETGGTVKYDLPNHDTSVVTTDGDSVGIDVLPKGKSIRGTHVRVFSASGDPDTDYYKLVQYAAEMVGESKGLKITVAPIEGHVKAKVLDRIKPKEPENNTTDDEEDDGEEDTKSKGKYNKNKPSTPTVPGSASTTEKGGDPINLMTGGFESENRLMTVAGVRHLIFGISYDSTDTDAEGDMGYGWYHTWESNVEREGQNVILHDKPGSSIVFTAENAMNYAIYGSYNAETGVVSVSANELPSEDYLPVSNAMEGYRMHRNADGYQLLMPDGSENGYDTEGKLVYSKNNVGQTVCISYGADTMTIADKATGKAIVATYSAGHLVSLTDPNGDTASFTYDANGNLSRVTSKRGTTNTYVYDDAHRIVEGYDTTGTLFVKNTYDEKGRVLTQDDNDESTPLLTLRYEENEENHTTQIFYTKTNGGEEVIVANSNGHGLSYMDSVGGTRTYTYNYDGELTSYRDADGSGCDYVRDDAGRILSQTDTKGNVDTYTYDKKGNLLSHKSSDGLSATWTYNAENQVIKSTENGVVKTYTYNADSQMHTCTTEGSGTVSYEYENGNVEKITYPNGKSDKFYYDNVGNVVKYENTTGRVTEYEVDAGGNVLRESVCMEDGSKVTTSATYDAYGKLLSITDAEGNKTSYTYNKHDQLKCETKANGSKTTLEYDEDGNVTSITYPDGMTTQTAVYDTAGNLKQVIDTLKQTTTAEYNSASQLIKATQADGGVVTYEYYDNGLLKTQTDAEGNTTAYAYDETGRICTMTDPKGNTVTITYDTYGNMNTITDGEGNTVTLTYNGFGEITSTTDANGNRTSFAYDVMGNCISTTDALGNVTEYTYDAAGQITAVTQKGKNGEDITISYSYDNLGNITSVTDGEGNTFRMTYDKVGNVTAIYDAYGQLAESYTYDSVYNQTSVTDGNGTKLLYSYDRMGNKIKSLNESNGSVTTYSYIGGSLISASTDALGGNTSATYDAMGNLESFTNPNGGVTTYTYDKNQNVTSESVGDYYKVTYTYDAAGNVKTMTNSRGQVTTYEYDKAGRVIKQSDEAGIIEYTYDANGNKLAVTETVSGNTVSANTITRTYDALNRVTSYTDAEGNTIKYSYDEFGNITSVTYPGGQEVAYTYDKNGNVLTMKDWNDRQTSYSYDKNGRLVTTQRPDGSVETRTYDKAGNLVSIKDVKKDGTVINDYTYNYDQSGNITTITDKSVAKNSPQTATDASVQMEYDSVNRLMKYNGKDVRYDADGNMIYGPLNGEMATFTYDCRNRLIQVTTDSGETTQYAYDAENVRTKVIKNAGTQKENVTTYVTDSVSHELSRVLEATIVDKAGNTETIRYTYGNGLVAQEKSACMAEESHATGEYLVYHFNHLGSTTAVTDEAGEIKYTYTYNIFGKLLSGNYGEVEFLYNGQYGVASDANGLYYMRARYYNIDIMRFINQDILTGSIDSSQSLNRYAYVEGNPVNFLDPFGLEKIELYSGKLHLIATILSATGSIVSQFAPKVGLVIGTIALGFDLGLYISDIIMSDFDSEVIQNAAFSLLKSAGIYTLGATAAEVAFGTVLLSQVYQALINGTSAGEAILSAAQGFTDWMIEIFVEDKGVYFY